jgi:hypothetical protein
MFSFVEVRTRWLSSLGFFAIVSTDRDAATMPIEPPTRLSALVCEFLLRWLMLRIAQPVVSAMWLRSLITRRIGGGREAGGRKRLGQAVDVADTPLAGTD